MISIHSQTTAWFDCDDTLVFWNWPTTSTPLNLINLTTPEGTKVTLEINREMVDQLKKHKSRHTAIIVWSAAGSEWAETVVKALELEDYVDLCISKPNWVYDDLPCTEFMPKSKWVGDSYKISLK
jgi:predicted phosphatase